MGATARDMPWLGLQRDADLMAARAAGWRGCDLAWERLQERANAAFREGDCVKASRLWRRAVWLARWRLTRDDPRYATSLANAGTAALLSGNAALARRRYARAFGLWGAAPDWVDAMTVSRRARSSLFHLRMESQHWDSYQADFRRRAMDCAREVAASLDAAAKGLPVPAQLHDRWRAQKPAAFDDFRKFLGAALLLAVSTAEPE